MIWEEAPAVVHATNMNRPGSKKVLPRIVTGTISLVAFTVLWFGVAGRLSWWQGWAFLLTSVAYVGLLVWRLSRSNPELLLERSQPAEKAESWDRIVMRIYVGLLMLLLIVSALDGGRFGWSRIPFPFQVMGWLFLVAAGAMVWHVMMINAFLSSWARIQEDRGQTVIQDGAYRYVRHPMYIGIVVAFLGIPLVLGSWWAMIPSVLIVALFVYRTYKEDRMLENGLAGYVEYKEKVRYRLLPRIW